MIKDVQEKKISFYTAECMEFETMGEVTECATLKEAFRIYQKMEQKRSGMGVGIGFILHDPDVLSTVISTILYIKEMGWSGI